MLPTIQDFYLLLILGESWKNHYLIMLKLLKMLNKLFNNVYQSLSHLLPAKHVKSVKIKKEKLSMVKIYFLLFKFLDSRDMVKFLNFILINIEKVWRQLEVKWIWESSENKKMIKTVMMMMMKIYLEIKGIKIESAKFKSTL